MELNINFAWFIYPTCALTHDFYTPVEMYHRKLKAFKYLMINNENQMP